MLVSQSVLLKDVNDDAETLIDLMRAFVEARVKPYYLHHGDLAPGTAHWRVPIARGPGIDAGLARPPLGIGDAGLHARHSRRPRQGADRATMDPLRRRRNAHRHGPAWRRTRLCRSAGRIASVGRNLRIGAQARRSDGLARGAQGICPNVKETPPRICKPGPVTTPFAKSRPHDLVGAHRAAGEVYPSPTLILTKSEVCCIMFVITESVLSLGFAGRGAAVLFDKLARAQPARETGKTRRFFYSNRSQPVEKARFGKINASKLESFY